MGDASSTSKLGFIGGSGIEGGQGNADSIYGSHDDHSTYGVAGSGWQGPGNGEAPGDLWNPAVSSHSGMAPVQQLAAPIALSAGNALATVDDEGREHDTSAAGACSKSATSKPSPGHMVMMGHALILGALSASKEVADGALVGDFSVSWSARFAHT